MTPLLVLVYILLIIGSLICTITNVQLLRGKITEMPFWYYKLNNVLGMVNLPSAIIVSILIAFALLRGDAHISALIIIVALIVVSFAAEQINEYVSCKNGKNTQGTPSSEYKTFFTFIDACNKEKNIQKQILAIVLENQKFFSDNIHIALNQRDILINAINEYIKFQQDNCADLLAERNKCVAFYQILGETARRINGLFFEFEGKLTASNSSLDSCNNSVLLDDLASSFKKEYRVNTDYLSKQIDEIVGRLSSMAFQYNQLTRFSNPYKNLINIYSAKIESALDIFENANKAEEESVYNAYNAVFDFVTQTKQSVNELFDKLKSRIKKYVLFQKNPIAQQTKKPALAKGYNEIHQLKKSLQTAKSKLSAIIVLWAITVISLVFALKTNYTNVVQLNSSQARNLQQVNTVPSENAENSSQLNIAPSEDTEHLDYLLAENERLENLVNSLQTEKNQLTRDKKQLDTLINSFEKRWSINITSIKIGNRVSNTSWLDTPGSSLIAKNMRYLAPVIMYNSLISGEVTFYIRIIDPKGEVIRNKSTSVSPEGFTYSNLNRIKRGGSMTLDLGVWGDGSKSIYRAGEWSIEVWCAGVCLRTQTVRLN
jgi:type IV secretory pathway VirB2 component (pilin)